MMTSDDDYVTAPPCNPSRRVGGTFSHFSYAPKNYDVICEQPQRGSSKISMYHHKHHHHDHDHDHRHHHQTGVSRKRFEQTAGTRLVVGYACTTC